MRQVVILERQTLPRVTGDKSGRDIVVVEAKSRKFIADKGFFDQASSLAEAKGFRAVWPHVARPHWDAFASALEEAIANPPTPRVAGNRSTSRFFPGAAAWAFFSHPEHLSGLKKLIEFIRQPGRITMNETADA
jgi:hypothetical protein